MDLQAPDPLPDAGIIDAASTIDAGTLDAGTLDAGDADASGPPDPRPDAPATAASEDGGGCGVSRSAGGEVIAWVLVGLLLRRRRHRA
jgi:hypothetical protein